MKKICLMVLLAMLAVPNIAISTPTTHIWGPSSDIQPYKLWHFGADMYIPVNRDDAGNRIATINDLGITVGILPFTKFNAEVGIDYRSGLGSADDYPLYFNAKAGIPEDSLVRGFPSIAIGGFDFGTKKDITSYNILYIKAGKTIPTRSSNLGRISLGYFTGDEQLLRDKNGDKDNSGVLAAWERTMTEISSKLWLCVEYMGTESAYGCFNIGGSWKVAPNTAVLIGYEIYNNDAFAETLTIQVDIDI